jgi:hypothetical protein
LVTLSDSENEDDVVPNLKIESDDENTVVVLKVTIVPTNKNDENIENIVETDHEPDDVDVNNKRKDENENLVSEPEKHTKRYRRTCVACGRASTKDPFASFNRVPTFAVADIKPGDSDDVRRTWYRKNIT